MYFTYLEHQDIIVLGFNELIFYLMTKIWDHFYQ